MLDHSSPEIIRELRRLMDARSDGLLIVDDVVEAAESPSSPLYEFIHDKDEKEAAQAYYRERARLLIRLTIQYLPVKDVEVKVRYFTSLHSDRYAGGGYRMTTKVLTDAEWRKQLLNDALIELQQFEKKYHMLRELADVFSAIRKVKRKPTAASKPKATRGVKLSA